MSGFEINVVRRRYIKMADRNFRTECVEVNDLVLLDVDDLGRVAIGTANLDPGRARLMAGGSSCYAGWLRATGVSLRVNRVVRVAMTVEVAREVGTALNESGTDNVDLCATRDEMDDAIAGLRQNIERLERDRAKLDGQGEAVDGTLGGGS